MPKHVVLWMSVMILSACPAKKTEEKPPIRDDKATAATVATVQKTPEQQGLFELEKLLVRTFLQADQIHRELLWVLMKDRPPLTKTIFGKVARALQLDMGNKLKYKGFFKCDQYTVQKQALGLGGFPAKLKIFELCGGMSGMALAELEMKKADEISLFFESEKLSEVIGVGASILNKRMLCQMTLDTERLLKTLKCENVYHDRQNGNSAHNGEIFHFKKYEYQKDKNDLLEVSGEVLKNLIPQKKIKVKVPLMGKIQFSEKELMPTEEDIAREQAERNKAIEEAKNVGRGIKVQPSAEHPAVSPDTVKNFAHEAAPNEKTIRPILPPDFPQTGQSGEHSPALPILKETPPQSMPAHNPEQSSQFQEEQIPVEEEQNPENQQMQSAPPPGYPAGQFPYEDQQFVPPVPPLNPFAPEGLGGEQALPSPSTPPAQPTQR